jgi:hypothetical protein
MSGMLVNTGELVIVLNRSFGRISLLPAPNGARLEMKGTKVHPKSMIGLENGPKVYVLKETTKCEAAEGMKVR